MESKSVAFDPTTNHHKASIGWLRKIDFRTDLELFSKTFRFRNEGRGVVPKSRKCFQTLFKIFLEFGKFFRSQPISSKLTWFLWLYYLRCTRWLPNMTKLCTLNLSFAELTPAVLSTTETKGVIEEQADWSPRRCCWCWTRRWYRECNIPHKNHTYIHTYWLHALGLLRFSKTGSLWIFVDLCGYWGCWYRLSRGFALVLFGSCRAMLLIVLL